MSRDENVQREGHDARKFMSDQLGLPYTAYRSLEEARSNDDGSVVLSGDYGGTIFLTAPARLVACTEEALVTLVSDLDAVTWMSGDPTVATVAFEARAVTSGVPGGDGGGVVVDGVWVHPTRLPSEIAAQAIKVVVGQRHRIDSALLRIARGRELDRKRTWREAHPPRSDRVRALGWDFNIGDPFVAFDE